MKATYLILFFATASACTSSVKKSADKRLIAIDSVKAFMSRQLNDPASYQPVSYDSLISRPAVYEIDDKNGRLLDSLHDDLTDSVRKYGDEGWSDAEISAFGHSKNYNKKLANFYNKKADSIHSLITINKSHFKPVTGDYLLRHTFRAKNGFGALTLNTKTFILDTNFRVKEMAAFKGDTD